MYVLNENPAEFDERLREAVRVVQRRLSLAE